MKKAFILSALAFALTAVPAYAATIELSPATVTVAPGSTVTVTILVNPAHATVAAVKSELSYPADLLVPQSFSFAPNWVVLTQSGYDQMSGGMVIKSAGYPGGFATTTALGTLTFTAKAAGTATLSVTNSSLVYASGGANALSGTQGASVITIQSVSASTSASGASTTASTSTTTSQRGTSGETTKPAQMQTRTTASSGAKANSISQNTASPVVAAPSESALTIATDTTAQATTTAQTAAVANAVKAGRFGAWWMWLLGVVVLALLGWWFSRSRAEA